MEAKKTGPSTPTTAFRRSFLEALVVMPPCVWLIQTHDDNPLLMVLALGAMGILIWRMIRRDRAERKALGGYPPAGYMSLREVIGAYICGKRVGDDWKDLPKEESIPQPDGSVLHVKRGEVPEAGLRVTQTRLEAPPATFGTVLNVPGGVCPNCGAGLHEGRYCWSCDCTWPE